MEKSPENSTLEETLGQYQLSLRGELPRTLRHTPLGDQGLVGGSCPGAWPSTPLGPHPSQDAGEEEGCCWFAFPGNQWRFPWFPGSPVPLPDVDFGTFVVQRPQRLLQGSVQATFAQFPHLAL